MCYHELSAQGLCSHSHNFVGRPQEPGRDEHVQFPLEYVCFKRLQVFQTGQIQKKMTELGFWGLMMKLEELVKKLWKGQKNSIEWQ